MEENKIWKCSCGFGDNTGLFCEECGAKRFEYWECTFCSERENKGKFCKNCGKKREVAAETEIKKWSCSCGETENILRFCKNCGSSRDKQRTLPRADLFSMKVWNCVCGKKGNQGMFCDVCRKPKERSEKEAGERLLEARYQSALRCMRKASTKEDCMEVAREFDFLKGYKDSDSYYKACRQKANYLGGNGDTSLFPQEIRQNEEMKKEAMKEKSVDVIKSYEWNPKKKLAKKKLAKKKFGKKHFIGITSIAVVMMVLVGFVLFGLRKEVGYLIGTSFAQAKEKYNLRNDMDEDLDMDMCYGSNEGMYILDLDENGNIDCISITGKGYEIYGLKIGMTLEQLKKKVPDGFVWEEFILDDYDEDGYACSNIYQEEQIRVEFENGEAKEIVLVLADESLGI